MLTRPGSGEIKNLPNPIEKNHMGRKETRVATQIARWEKSLRTTQSSAVKGAPFGSSPKAPGMERPVLSPVFTTHRLSLKALRPQIPITAYLCYDLNQPTRLLQYLYYNRFFRQSQGFGCNLQEKYHSAVSWVRRTFPRFPQGCPQKMVDNSVERVENPLHFSHRHRIYPHSAAGKVENSALVGKICRIPPGAVENT